MSSLSILLLVLLSTLSSASKILLMPFPWKSHVSELRHIGDTLASHGHELHIVLPSHYPDIEAFRGNKSNIRPLEYTARYPDFLTFSDSQSNDMFETMIRITPIQDFRTSLEGFVEVCYNVLEDDDLAESIAGHQFDLVIIDAFPNTRCYYILAYRLGLPYISVSTQYEPWLFRAPALPSFVPFPFYVPPLTSQMTFWQRLVNLWTLFDWSAQTQNLPYLSDGLVLKYAPDKPPVTMNYLAGKSLIWLFDTDITIDYPRPMMANEVNIGGLSTKPAKSLSKSMQHFLDSAEEGVILAAFGSSSVIPEKYMRVMVESFKRLSPKVHVVLRWAFDDKPDVPANIRLLPWIKQNDILGHPNTKLFITHCGANGQFEALYHGVPMLGFPSFADQPYNAKRAESHGFAETLNIQSFSIKQLQQTIEKMLRTKSYSQKIGKASEVFRSQPMSPRERAAFWIEHVIKFGGDHLRSYAMEMPWYQYLMIDILMFVLIVAVSGAWITVNTVMLCLRRFQQVKAELRSNGQTKQHSGDRYVADMHKNKLKKKSM